MRLFAREVMPALKKLPMMASAPPVPDPAATPLSVGLLGS